MKFSVPSSFKSQSFVNSSTYDSSSWSSKSSSSNFHQYTTDLLQNEYDQVVSTQNATLTSPAEGGVKIPYKKLLAGSVAGTADVWACHGFDRVKTHMQQHGGKTIIGSTQEILKKGGIRALYEGIWPMNAEAICKVGMRYFFAAYARDWWKQNVQKETDPKVAVSVAGNVFAGVVAGTIESLLVVIPCELLKVRHMTQVNHESFLTVARNVIKEEGISALYKGGGATWLRQVTNQMIRFPVFYASSNALKEYRGEKNLPVFLNLSVGAFSGMASTVVNTPLDTIKTRLQRQGNNLNTQQTIKAIVNEGGVLALWSGTLPRMVRVAPGQAITWAVFEKMVQFLGKD